MSRWKDGDVAFSVLLILIGLFIAYGSLSLGFWNGRSLQAGFLPFASALLLVAFAGFALIGRLSSPGREDEGPIRKPAIVLAVMLAAVLALPVLGTAFSVFLMMATIFVIIERLPIVRSLVVSLLMAGSLHAIFRLWFGVPLPRGFMGL